MYSLLAMIFTFTICFCFVTQMPPHLNLSYGFHEGHEMLPWTIPENLDGSTPLGCFNQILLSAVGERVEETLSRSLQIYSTLHQNHVDRLSTVQFYLTKYKYRFGYYLHIPEIFNHSTRRAFMLFPDRYRHYSGDVLASLDATSYFAFFPEDYSTRRFKNIFQPTEVHFFPTAFQQF